MNFTLPALILLTNALICCQQENGVVLDTPWAIDKQIDFVHYQSETAIDPEILHREITGVVRELRTSINLPAADKLVEIRLFANVKTFNRYVHARAPGAGHRKALFVRSGEISQIFAYQSRTLITDIRHEMTHVMLHQNLPFLPLWIDEGLAEYFETRPQDRDSAPRLAQVRWKARVGWNRSIASLEDIPSAERMTGEDYRDSWAWVCLLLNESDETRELLTDYLGSIRDGAAPMPFSHFLEAGLPEARQRTNHYFRKMTLADCARGFDQSSPQ